MLRSTGAGSRDGAIRRLAAHRKVCRGTQHRMRLCCDCIERRTKSAVNQRRTKSHICLRQQTPFHIRRLGPCLNHASDCIAGRSSSCSYLLHMVRIALSLLYRESRCKSASKCCHNGVLATCKRLMCVASADVRNDLRSTLVSVSLTNEKDDNGRWQNAGSYRV